MSDIRAQLADIQEAGFTPVEVAERTRASLRQVYRWFAGSPPRTGALRHAVAQLHAEITLPAEKTTNGGCTSDQPALPSEDPGCGGPAQASGLDGGVGVDQQGADERTRVGGTAD